jgi:DNA polymerase II large subunit
LRFYDICRSDIKLSDTSEASPDTKGSEEFFDLDAVRQQILTEGLEMTRLSLNAQEGSAETIARMIRQARLQINCPKCEAGTRLTIMNCADCVILRRKAQQNARTGLLRK